MKGVRTGMKGTVTTLVPERAMAILTGAEKGELAKDHSVPRDDCDEDDFRVVEGIFRETGVDGCSVEIFMSQR